MNKLFIAVGSLIIVVLFTALIGPYYVDWTSYRDTFEREASAYIGRPVTVDGKASVRLLPTPVLSFTDIHIGDAERPDVEMDRFRAELELAPLLKGEFRIIQMAVERPRFHLDLGGLAENRGVFGGRWKLDPSRISLERLQIVDGSATIDYNGKTWQAEHIAAVIEANTLLGPAKVDGHLMLGGDPVDIRAGFGRYTDLNSIAMNLQLSSPRFPVTLSTDATLYFAPDAPLNYEGKATIEGVKAEGEAAPAPMRWSDFRASGAFALAPSDLTFQEVQVSYGATERPLLAEASGQVNFGEKPDFDVTLSARQIDLDGTLAGGPQDPVAIESALGTLVGLLPRATPPPLPGVLRLEAQGVMIGGNVVQGVAAELKTAGNSWVVQDFTALLPGKTRVDVKGTLGLAAETTFRGRASMASQRPTTFATWWRGDAGSAARIGTFSVEADLDLTPGHQRLSSLVAETAGGVVNGFVDMHLLSGQRLVNVDLNAKRADLVETRELAELLVGPVARAGSVDQMTLSFNADVLSAGGVDAHGVEVEGGLDNGELNFSRFVVANLAGASIKANGTIKDPLGTPSGRIDAEVEADNISGAAKFLATLLPQSDTARRLEEAAPLLSPMKADIFAEAGAAGERVLLEVSGSFADTHLYARAEGTGSLAQPETLAGQLNLTADGQDSAKVLRQLGIRLIPVESAPMSIEANFDGALASAGKLKVKGSVAGVDLSYGGETALKDGHISLDGDFSAKSDDVDQALLLAGVALPGIVEGHAATASGRLEYADKTLKLALKDASFDGEAVSGSLSADLTKRIDLSGSLDVAEISLPALSALAVGTVPEVQRYQWSDAPFAEALPRNVSLDFALNAKKLDLGAPIGATDAKLDLALADGKLTIDLRPSAFAGGTLGGSIATTIDNGEAELSLSATLKGATLQSLVWDQLGLPTASGTLDVSFQGEGRGRSTAAVVATLSGGGSFSISEGRLNALNPEALTAVMAAAEGDKDPNEDKARETFASLFESGAMAFGNASGALSIANGVVSARKISLAEGTAKVLADATVNLNTLDLVSNWSVRIEEQGGAEDTQPYVPISFHGPIVHPAHDIDLAPLLNQMRARFLQRKLKELEELQRMKQEAERRAAEEDAQAAAQRAAEAEMTTGTTGSAPMSLPEAAAPELSQEPLPETDPAAPTEPAAPLDLVPTPTPTATPAPPTSAPRRAPQSVAPRRAAKPQPQYKTLPNGIIVKIR